MAKYEAREKRDGGLLSRPPKLNQEEKGIRERNRTELLQIRSIKHHLRLLNSLSEDDDDASEAEDDGGEVEANIMRMTRASSLRACSIAEGFLCKGI